MTLEESQLLGRDPAFHLGDEGQRVSYRVWYSDGEGKVRQRTFADRDIAIDYAARRPNLITVQQLIVIEIWNRRRRDNTETSSAVGRFGTMSMMAMQQKCRRCALEMLGSHGIVYFPPLSKSGYWVHVDPCAIELGLGNSEENT